MIFKQAQAFLRLIDPTEFHLFLAGYGLDVSSAVMYSISADKDKKTMWESERVELAKFLREAADALEKGN
jgi:hypothetical protein